MDWQEIQRIERQFVVPELARWANELSKPDGPQPPPIIDERLPQWALAIVMDSITATAGGPRDDIGRLLLNGGRARGTAYGAMACLLRLKYGIPEERMPPDAEGFILSIEDRIRLRGPLDPLLGKGPGKPTVISRDPQGRLHNPDGPAVRFADGGSYFALRGVAIPVNDWRVRDDAKAIIRHVGNVEVRGALIERLGVGRFLTEAGLEPVQSDRFGKLYRVSTAAESHAYVHVTCPSTSQEYFMAVPGNCRSAHEAVAWSFTMVPEDYDPMKEA